MPETLFTRLASYSQNPAKKSIENFTTEVLAYLIKFDRAFRRTFVRHVIPDGRIQRRFRSASAQPQQSFGNGIVDLVLSSGDRKVLVEVKIQAAETVTKVYGRGWVSQVKKYLSYRDGHVVYLTTRSVSSPDVNSRYFLGHFFFEDLHKRLLKVKAKLTAPGRLFVEFMEENEMKSLEPFTKSDLAIAEKAFLVAKKCEAILDEIVSAVEPQFRRWFRTRTRFTGGHFSPTYRSAYAWTKNFRRGNVQRVYIYLEPWDGELCYGVSARVLRTDMKKVNRHLGWIEDGGFLSSVHPVRPDSESRSYIERVLKDLRKLKGALNRAY